MEFEYKCENCGACCRFWNPARYDPSIVTANGDCKFLDLETKKCSIYENRPDFCRVEKWYEINDHINQSQTYEDYLERQKMGCDILIRMKEIEDEILSKCSTTS